MTNLEILRKLKTNLAKNLYVKSGLMNVDLKTINKIKMFEYFYEHLFRDLIEIEQLSIIVERIDGDSSNYNMFFHYNNGKLIKSYLAKEDDCLHLKYNKYDNCGRLIETKDDNYKFLYTYNEFGDITKSVKLWNSGNEENVVTWIYEYYPNTNKKKIEKWESRIGKFIREYDEKGNEILFKRTHKIVEEQFLSIKKYDEKNNIVEEIIIDNDSINIINMFYNQNGHIIEKIDDSIYENQHTISKDIYKYEYYPDGKTIKINKETMSDGAYSIKDYDMQGNLIKETLSNGRVFLYDIEYIADVCYTVMSIDKNLMFFEILQ